MKFDGVFGKDPFCPLYMAWVTECKLNMMVDDKIHIFGCCKGCPHLKDTIVHNREMYRITIEKQGIRV
ncbi:hypothetical protein AGMMS50268_04140 [Spirochaetia bacterium]|nr:hypothetical protein AGMMS50268_04140 [Spirochaetia bacterium]